MPTATASSPRSDALVAFHSVNKSFGSTQALIDLSLQGSAGSVHAITGENGAGKSTLMNLLAGVHQPDSGEIRLRGQAVSIQTPGQARRAGISTIFQELTLLPNLSVAENLFLGRELHRAGIIDRALMRRRAREALDLVKCRVNVDTSCQTLSVAEQQLIEIAKGLMADADTFILDEPTAALNAPEVDTLGELIHSLRVAGKLVFYISHRLEEIFRFSDTVSVLKDGRLVGTSPVGELTQDDLISLMVGRPLGQLYPPRNSHSSRLGCALEVSDLAPSDAGRAVSFRINRGEILGFAGLQGQGQREIIRAIAGVGPHVSGRVTRYSPNNDDAQKVNLSIVAVALSGIGFIPEDRKSEGLYLSLSIEQNVALGMLRQLSIWRRARVKKSRIDELLLRMRVRSDDQGQSASSLSGGNQQKVMLGRWLASGVDVLLVEEPTRGVDVGAKSEIYALLRGFAELGGAVLVTSSELTEILGLCDRILVVRDGEITAELEGVAASEEEIMRYALAGSAAEARKEV
jgi:ABC-type sugar transport system ATPase subunit